MDFIETGTSEPGSPVEGSGLLLEASDLIGAGESDADSAAESDGFHFLQSHAIALCCAFGGTIQLSELAADRFAVSPVAAFLPAFAPLGMMARRASSPSRPPRWWIDAGVWSAVLVLAASLVTLASTVPAVRPLFALGHATAIAVAVGYLQASRSPVRSVHRPFSRVGRAWITLAPIAAVTVVAVTQRATHPYDALTTAAVFGAMGPFAVREVYRAIASRRAREGVSLRMSHLAMGGLEMGWCLSLAILFATDRGPARTESRYCAISFVVAALLFGALRAWRRAKATRATA